MADETRVDRCRRYLEEAAAAHREAARSIVEAVGDATTRCERALLAGGAVLVCGNGGSAAESQHLAAEMTGRFQRDRRGWPVMALTTDTSALTAIANDYGFERVFARQVEALGRSGDVLLAISTSGASPNVLAAAGTARSRGLTVIALTGPVHGALGALADVVIAAPGTTAARVQEVHLTVLHAMCDALEAALPG
jgi:D-sedoheptulose 7-phosphate isomerase